MIDQFINTASNKRTDDYGGSLQNRSRFAIETAKKVAEAIGPEKTGIRLSPYGVFNDMEIFDGLEETYAYLAEELGKLNLAYIHIVDHSSAGAPEVTNSVKQKIKKAFDGPIILSGGYNRKRAEQDLKEGNGELIAFGKAYLSNPDLAYRLEHEVELNDFDMSTFYTPGEKGYTDYSFVKEKR